MEDNQDTTFCRRKFTITEALDEVLVNMAEQHYQNNVSLCLRAAIEDHRATLTGTNTDVLTQQLEQRVEKIEQRQEDIITTLHTLEDQLTKRESTSTRRDSDSGQLTDLDSRILAVLEEADGGLRIADLADKLDVRTGQLPPALGGLVDQGVVVTTGTAPRRFHLAGTTITTSSDQTDEFLN